MRISMGTDDEYDNDVLKIETRMLSIRVIYILCIVDKHLIYLFYEFEVARSEIMTI
jgi:hypothetical protein